MNINVVNLHKLIIYEIDLKGVGNMLDEKICDLREKLNKSIEKGKDYDDIYNISIQLDNLIADYYKKTIIKVRKN